MREFKAKKIGKNEFEVDMRGWVCPFPKYAVEGLMKKMPKGGSLQLLVDCPSAPADVPGVVTGAGGRVLSIDQVAGGEWRIVIEN